MSASTWLRYGCFGCLGVVVLVLLVGGGVVGVAFVQVRSEKVEDRSVRRQVPGVRTAREPGSEPPATAGRVRIDVSGVEQWRLEPAPPGEPIRILARYDEKSYELVERFEEADDGSWTHDVEFRRTSGYVLAALKAVFGGSSPELRVLLPTDTPIALEVRFGQGGFVADLGGLWLTTADVEFEMGGMELGFDEPTRVPMERLAIEGAMGGMSVHGVGHASPRELDVAYRMGGMELDLGGPWSRDSDVSVRLDMAGGALRLPRGVNVEGIDAAGPRVRENREVGLPTLRFEVSTRRGELEIVD